MKQVLLVMVAVLGVHSSVVFAEKQRTYANVKLDYKSNNTKVGFYTSDAFAFSHDCRTEDSDSCMVDDYQSSFPKNIANFLCLDGDVVTEDNYEITPNCQSLLDQGKGSCLPLWDTMSCGSRHAVAPECFWRTSSTASAGGSWYWKITKADNGQYAIDCSNEGYQGVSPK